MPAQTTNPNSSEYSPEQRRQEELTPEEIAAQNELYEAWNDTLYAGVANEESEEGTITVEDLGQRVDQQQVSYGVDGGKYLDQHEKTEQIHEAGLETDARDVQSEANAELAKLGVDNGVKRREAMSKTVAETLVDGQGEDSGRLSYEDRRDAKDAVIATELDKALRRGETETLQHLPPSVAVKVAAWLGNIGERYGAAEFAPNEEVAKVGAYIAFAEKLSDVSSSETIVQTDPASGEVKVDSIEDLIIRILDGDPEVIKSLRPEQYEAIQRKQQALEGEGERYYSGTVDAAAQQELVDEVRRALLQAQAEQLAQAT